MADNPATPSELIPFGVLHQKMGALEPPDVLLAIDPGSTTGYAVFEKLKFIAWGQLPTGTVSEGGLLIGEVMDLHKPTQIVFEDYRVYGHRSNQHIGSSLHTSRLIGVIEFLCAARSLVPAKQMATQAKGFVNDDKLKAWRFYVPGQRHARDAIRHACYYILFHKTPKPPKATRKHNVG